MFPANTLNMSRVETIHIENRRKIKDIIPKFPELVESNAGEALKKEYYNILSKEDELQNLRRQVWKLEEEIKTIRQEFDLKSGLFEISFESDTKEVETSKCSVMVEGHGNSTLGRTNLF